MTKDTCEAFVNAKVVPAFASAETATTLAAETVAALQDILRQMEGSFCDVKIKEGPHAGKNFHPNRFCKMHADAAKAAALITEARTFLALAHREAQKCCDEGGIVVTGGGGGK